MKNNIATIRKGKNYSQIEFAKRIGISHWWLNHIENGKRRPSMKLLEIIAEKLEVSIKDIFLD